MKRLPAYLAARSPKAEQVRVIEQSQLLGTYIFAPRDGMFDTILSGVNRMIARYGRESITLLPAYEKAWTGPVVGQPWPN